MCCLCIVVSVVLTDSGRARADLNIRLHPSLLAKTGSIADTGHYVLSKFGLWWPFEMLLLMNCPFQRGGISSGNAHPTGFIITSVSSFVGNDILPGGMETS